MKTMTLYFCPSCGEYYPLPPDRKEFGVWRYPKCGTCGVRVQRTGLHIMLLGMVLAIPCGMTLCAEATAVAEILAGAFAGLAVMRWGRQFVASKRKKAASP